MNNVRLSFNSLPRLLILVTGFIMSTSFQQASAACICDGRITDFSMRYDPTATSSTTVHAYADKDYTVLINTFTNVQPGDIITLSSSTIGWARFGAKVYFFVGDSNPAMQFIHTSCSDDITGMTYLGFTVLGYTDYNNNMCYQPSSIGNRVFDDLNTNGIQDAGEPGIADVEVMLFDEIGSPMGSEVTDVNGLYQFDGLNPGNYFLQIVSYPGAYVSTHPNAGSNDELDSDISIAELKTEIFTLTPDTDDDRWDMGLALSTSFPVEMLGFSAIQEGQSASLRWSTASELNNDRFEIERSIDGGLFERVGTVNGTGTTPETQYYRFIDNKITYLGQDKLFYRLKQVDLNGNFEYSHVLELQVTDTHLPVLNVFPNPAIDRLNIEFQAEFGTLRLTDAKGTIILKRQLGNSPQVQMLELNISSLTPGLYFLNLSTPDAVITKSVVVR